MINLEGRPLQKNAAEDGGQARPELVVVILNIEYMSLTEQPWSRGLIR